MKYSCRSYSKLLLLHRWSLAATVGLIGTLGFASSASALSSFVSASYQLGGFFPVSQQDPLGIPITSPSFGTTDSAGNSITELVTQSASFGILRSTAQSFVITNTQNNQPASGFATSTVGFTDFLTVQSVSNPVGTPVQIHLQLFLEGILGANGTAPNQTGNNDYAQAHVTASITVPQAFGPLTVLPGPTSTTGTATGVSTLLPVAFTDLFLITQVGVTFQLNGLLQTSAFANTFGGALCCTLPQNITGTYSGSNAAAAYENTAIFSLQSITDGDFITSASGATYSGAQTPLPGALPLFITGLGALGLLGWRRKKKAGALAA
jgi:hypothetical protein